MALPPKPTLQPTPMAKRPPEDALAKAKREKDEVEAECQALEEEVEALKAKYEQYFLGVERREPNRQRDELKKRVMRLKGAFTRNTGLKFRIQSLHARFISYERLWLRSAREKEEGTYRRDLFKARLRGHHDEPAPPSQPQAGAASGKVAAAKPGAAAPAQGQDLAAALAAAAGAKPAAPAAGRPAPPAPKAAPPAARPPASPGGMSDAQMKSLYDSYIAAKKSCREDTSRLSYDAVAKSVSKQIPELMTRYKAKSVEFKVEVKDGKAVLKAIPKV